MSAAARWDPERQRRALSLMGIEPLAFRAMAARAPAPSRAAPTATAAPAAAAAAAPKPAAAGRKRLRVVGLSEIARDDGLLSAILRSLRLSPDQVVFRDVAEDSPLPALHFGPGSDDGSSLPGLSALRADPRAKRTAWQAVLRPLALRMRRS